MVALKASHPIVRTLLESSGGVDESRGGSPINWCVSVCPMYTALAAEVPPQVGVPPHR